MPAKKKIEFAEDRDDEEDLIEVWDVKKIVIGVVILILLIFGGVVAKRLLLHESVAPESFVPKINLSSVKGVTDFFNNSSSNTPHVQISLPTQQDVQNKIQELQQQVTHLDVKDIASSSPQVQAVIKQLQDLPSGPVSQVKDACVRLCNNL